MFRLHPIALTLISLMTLLVGCSYSSNQTDALACEDGATRDGQVCVDGFWVNEPDCDRDDCCIPENCEFLGLECGMADDGCGGTLDCGGCPEGESCGNGGPNTCGPGDCEPQTCASLGLECGEVDPGCGLLPENCGECMAPETCGAVAPNLCACVATTCEEEGAECGMIPDGCGQMLSCGTCDDPESCAGDPNQTPNLCGCTPTTTCRSEGVACGMFTNDCGEMVQCDEGCFEKLSVYDRHSCAVDFGGTGIKCWGENDEGQLGTGDRVESERPVPVVFADDTLSWVDVAVGVLHTCAVASDGSVWCWGANDEAQLGVDPNDTNGPGMRSVTPNQVPGVVGATSVSASANHTCAIETDQILKCWGENDFNQLGITGQNPVLAPTAVTGVDAPIVAIATSPVHSCAVGNGEALCWGSDSAGQLGNGNGQGDSATPDKVSDNDTYTSITTGLLHSCGITDQGVVKCWGAIQYDSSNNALGTQQSPAEKTIASMTSMVSANHTSTCSIHAAGVQCFGRNDAGQLGDGTTVDATDPVDVSMFSTGASVASGVRYSCVIDPQNAAWCWGRNESGQLGDGTVDPSLTPVQVLP